MQKKYAWETASTSSVKPKKEIERGCAVCPQSSLACRKVIRLEHVLGKRAMIWAQCPGQQEELYAKELVGPSGKFLWKHLAAEGLTRDQFDVQNVVRCRTTKKVTGDYGTRIVDAEPSKEVTRCCSLYTDQAIVRNAGNAVVHLVLGHFAAKTLLGKEYRKDHPVFWSKRLNAKVICIAHPAYFLRGGTRTKLEEFKAGIRAVKESLTGETSSRFGYIESQDYTGATTWAEVKPMLIEIQKLGRKERLSVDIEGDTINGKPVVLAVGFCGKPGHSRLIYVDHPEYPATPADRAKVVSGLKRILEDHTIKKSFHFGSYDVPELHNALGIDVAGYDFDTNYAEYMAHSARRAFGLAEIAHVRFQEFSGYKDIIQPYVAPDANGQVHYGSIPKSVMTVYTGADADLGKRVELSTRKKVDLRLLQVYIDAAFIIDAMQQRGPKLDQDYHAVLTKIVPKHLINIRTRLSVLAGDPDFNPNSPSQAAALLYDTFKMPYVMFDKKSQPMRTTGKEALQLIADRTDNEFPRLLLDFRKYDKVNSTYLPNYLNSAKMHGNEIRTRWHLTGTVTSRLRSGAGKDGKRLGLINMQNLHGSPMVQNLLVSDTKWPDLSQFFKAKYIDKQVILNGKPTIVKDAVVIGDGLKAANRYADYNVFLAADYSQAELRMLAHMSGDELLIDQFQSGEDIHSLVVHELIGWPVDVVKNDEEKRRLGKNIHFGVVFGLSEKGLVDYAHAKGAKLADSLIIKAYRRYFERYKGVSAYIDKQRKLGDQLGYVDTLFGFRREIDKHSADRDTFWGNQAINSPIQGSSHNALLMAMAVLRHNPDSFWALRNMFAEIHDAFYFYTTLQNLPEAYLQVKQLMEHEVIKYMKDVFGIEFAVPMIADAKAGFRYGAMAKYKGEGVDKFLTNWYGHNFKIETKVEEELRRLQNLEVVSLLHPKPLHKVV